MLYKRIMTHKAVFALDKEITVIKQAHRFRQPLCKDHLEKLYDSIQQPRERGKLFLSERTKDVIRRISILRPAYAHTDTCELPPAKMLLQRPQSVVAAMPSPLLELDLAERDIKLVMDYEKIGRGQLVELHGLLHRAPGKVHECLGFQKQEPVPAVVPLTKHSGKALAGDLYTRFLCQSVQNHETRVVAGP